jgi:hypothetical protein
LAGATSPASSHIPGKGHAARSSALAQTVGTISSQAIDASASLLASLPLPVQQAVHSPLGAAAVTWALLLDDDRAKRAVQTEQLRAFAPQPLFDETATIFPFVQALDVKWKLPLVDLAVPSLRSMSPKQFGGFRKGLKLLVQADNEVTLFEFCLWTVIDRRVGADPGSRSRQPRRLSVLQLREHAASLLNAVCSAGDLDPAASAAAFGAATAPLAGLLAAVDYAHLEDFSPDALGKSLAALAGTSFKVRKGLLEACSICILFDQIVEANEAHLLRTIAYALDLPLPPMLELQNRS